jgi:AraC-like DNA-binding protein
MKKSEMTLTLEKELEPWLIFRSYQSPDGSEVFTYEIPATVVRAIGLSKMHQQLDAFMRGQAERKRSADLKDDVFSRLRANLKPMAIAHELGCSEAYVRHLRRKMNGMSR